MEAIQSLAISRFSTVNLRWQCSNKSVPRFLRSVQSKPRKLRLFAAIGDMRKSSHDDSTARFQIGGEMPTTSTCTRKVCLTIHGVQLASDINRLNSEIKALNGIVDVWMGELVEGGPREGYVTVQLEVENEVGLALLAKSIQNLDNSKLLVLPFKMNSWLWRGYNVKFGVAGCGHPVILVHGFGGNAGHFANLISLLADDYKVYAIDLLGFGASEKPVELDYSPDLWAEIVTDFAKEFTEDGAVLIGNSIGSLTALTAAAKSDNQLIRGLVLLNCAGAMNRKGLTEDGFLLQLLSPVFMAVEYLLSIPRVANFLFNRFRKKDNIKKILMEQAYRNKDAVTDQLVDILYHPSTVDGAVDVFVKVFTGDNPGSRPEKLMSSVNVPVLVLWGDSDAWTPVDGPVARFFKHLAGERSNVQVHALKDVGHCPHDDRPELAAGYILKFLASLNWIC